MSHAAGAVRANKAVEGLALHGGDELRARGSAITNVTVYGYALDEQAVLKRVAAELTAELTAELAASL